MAVRPSSLALVALLATSAAVPAAAARPPAGADQVKPTPPATPPTPVPPPVQARPGWVDNDAPRTDQTVDVVKGTRLVLASHAGEVVVHAWDRDQVRVQASHGSRDRIDVQTADSTLRIRTRTSTRGPGGPVDYTLTVPRWMALNLSGTYLAATVDGTTAEVNVETVGGDLTLKGGSGAVSLRSIEGEIRVEGASGKVNASTVNDSITLTGVTGDVVAETVNGDVAITNTKASSLEISTVNGDVRFEGPTADKGTYRISTHQGDIRVSLGAQANATVFVRTFRGDFSSDFAVTLPKDDAGRDGNKRFNFTLGAGSARVELQSFQGDIHVAKGPLRSRERQRDRAERAGRVDRDEPAWARDIERAVEQSFGPEFEANIEAAVDATVETALRDQFGANWQAEMERLRDWARTRVAPMAPAAPPAPPAPPAPRAPRAPRPPQP